MADQGSVAVKGIVDASVAACTVAPGPSPSTLRHAVKKAEERMAASGATFLHAFEDELK